LAIVTEEVEISLNDPITMERIKEPVKGNNCNHKSAFDKKVITEFIKNNEKKCPICKKDFEYLVVDPLYVMILVQVQQSCEKVKVFKDNTFLPI